MRDFAAAVGILYHDVMSSQRRSQKLRMAELDRLYSVVAGRQVP